MTADRIATVTDELGIGLERLIELAEREHWAEKSSDAESAFNEPERAAIRSILNGSAPPTPGCNPAQWLAMEILDSPNECREAGVKPETLAARVREFGHPRAWAIIDKHTKRK